eukprot:scaffold2584_cov141-Skeletonema_menzelii.AAC.2
MSSLPSPSLAPLGPLVTNMSTASSTILHLIAPGTVSVIKPTTPPLTSHLQRDSCRPSPSPSRSAISTHYNVLPTRPHVTKCSQASPEQ